MQLSKMVPTWRLLTYLSLSLNHLQGPLLSTSCVLALWLRNYFRDSKIVTAHMWSNSFHFSLEENVLLIVSFLKLQITVFRMGSEGHQDIDLAILTALLKGKNLSVYIIQKVILMD